MLAAWTEILPVFVVKWLARRHCERWTVNDTTLAIARPDVYIRVG